MTITAKSSHVGYANGESSTQGGGAVFQACRRLWVDYLPLFRADILFASFALNITSLALPLVTLQVYDRIIPNVALDTMSLLIVGLIGALMIESILRLVRSFITGWLGAQYEHATGSLAVRKLLATPINDFEETAVGEHLDRLSSIDPVRDFYASQAMLTLVDFPFAILFLALLGVIGGSLVVVPIILMVVFGLIAHHIGKKLRGKLTERSTWDDRRYNFIIEVLNGIHTLKGLTMEPLMLRRYERLMENCARVGHGIGYLNSLAQSIGSAFSQMTMVIVASVGSLYVMSGQISVGALAACTLLAGRTVQPILRALGVWSRFQNIQIAEERLDEIDATPVEPNGEAVPNAINLVELKNVTLKVPGREAPLFENINFEIARGDVIGVKGPNGCGKSTLLGALMGLIDPASGDIFFNERKIDVWDRSAIRQHIAYLPQRAVLFQGTVLDNLTAFEPEKNIDQALEYACRLGLDRVFASLPDGYETQINAGGRSSVAAGIAQRIAIVRALVRQPSLILFDEANSAFDRETDVALHGLLQELKRQAAIVLVSYRPSLLAIAERQIDLSNRGIREIDLPMPANANSPNAGKAGETEVTNQDVATGAAS
ncbi:MAG: ABC transporter transmembrane domain-containing protein [Pseudomonadota bacterium]